MRVYRGWRDFNGTAHVTVRIVGRHGVPMHGRRLRLRLDLDNHSPTGVEWGYGGSGPAQLALALLADAVNDDERALRLHQPFKWAVVAKWKQDEAWSMTDEDVRVWADKLDRKRSA
jgi:hypothetical protein